jgi:NTP pyrophosphatase (non-canonical NTP hydrolase)
MTKCKKCNGLGGIKWRDGDEATWEYCDECNGTGEITGCSPGELYKRALDLWGEEAQIKMAIEECAELIVKLAKLGRNKNGSTEADVAEEVADVEIMLSQLRLIFGNDAVELAKKRKLERLLNRVGC